MSKALKIILLVLKILLGLVFIFSAVAKMIGIDRFEVYVYSFGFFSMDWAFILARICIAGEFLLGVGLVSNLCNRLTTTVTLLVLLLFTIFFELYGIDRTYRQLSVFWQLGRNIARQIHHQECYFDFAYHVGAAGSFVPVASQVVSLGNCHRCAVCRSIYLFSAGFLDVQTERCSL